MSSGGKEDISDSSFDLFDEDETSRSTAHSLPSHRTDPFPNHGLHSQALQDIPSCQIHKQNSSCAQSVHDRVFTSSKTAKETSQPLSSSISISTAQEDSASQENPNKRCKVFVKEVRLSACDVEETHPSATCKTAGNCPFSDRSILHSCTGSVHKGHSLDADAHESTPLGSSSILKLEDGDQSQMSDLVSPGHSESSLEVSSLVCPFCQTTEPTLAQLEAHISTNHPDNTDEGAVCGAAFLQSVCPMCDLDLETESSLTAHMLSVHTEGDATCPLCGLCLPSDQEMQVHVKTHENEPPHYSVGASDYGGAEKWLSHPLACPLCGVVLADSDLLTSHVESHFSPQHSPGGSKASALNIHLEGHFSPQHSPGTSGKPTEILASRNKENIPRSEDPNRFVASKKDTTVPLGPSQRPSTSASLSRHDTHKYRKQYEKSLEKAVMRGEIDVREYHEQRSSMAGHDLHGVDDGSSRVDGLIELLARLYRQEARPGQVVHLSSPTSYFTGSHGDRGWGCGYRNFQMLLSCLITQPDLAARLSPGGHPAIPSIPKVQQMIEAAWRAGFDPEGRQQLRGKLVGTQKWIGATEIVATFSSLGVRCRLADFHAPSSSDGTHPRLVEWITDHFTSKPHQFISPLYLQHQGHSRTVVGVEQDRGTTRLLLFDPGSRTDHIAGLVSGERLAWKSLRTFRRTVNAFKARQYQVVAVTGLLSRAEMEDAKLIRSERVS